MSNQTKVVFLKAEMARLNAEEAKTAAELIALEAQGEAGFEAQDEDGSLDGEVLLMSVGSESFGEALLLQEVADVPAAPGNTFGFHYSPLAGCPAEISMAQAAVPDVAATEIPLKAEAADPDVDPAPTPAKIRAKHSRLNLPPSTPLRPQPPSSTQDSPTSVLESDRLREIECAVAVALKMHTAAREAESQKHAEQMN
jgi:hypothetical protein